MVDPAGDYFDPPCGTCTAADIPCEKNVRGGACVECKTKKKRCDYSLVSMRKQKSQRTIESEDDRSPPPQDESEPEAEAPPRKTANARGTIRRPKNLPDAGRIKKAVARAHKQIERTAAKKARMEIEVEPQEDREVIPREVHRRRRGAAAHRQGE